MVSHPICHGIVASYSVARDDITLTTGGASITVDREQAIAFIEAMAQVNNGDLRTNKPQPLLPERDEELERLLEEEASQLEPGFRRFVVE